MESLFVTALLFAADVDPALLAQIETCKDPVYVNEGRALRDQLRAACEDPSALARYGEAKSTLAKHERFVETWKGCFELRDFNEGKLKYKDRRVFKKAAQGLSHPMTRGDDRQFKACPDKFKENYASAFAKDLKILEREADFIQGSVDRKDFEEAKGKLSGPRRDLEGLKAAAADLGTEAERALVDEELAKLAKMEARFEKEIVKALRKKKCPKGSKRNKRLEKKLGRVYDDWVARHTPGKSKRLVLKMDGKVVKETLINGRRETANTILCYRDLTREGEPACHYDKLSFSREKPNGGKWGPWTRGGAGENGRLFCKNVK